MPLFLQSGLLISKNRKDTSSQMNSLFRKQHIRDYIRFRLVLLNDDDTVKKYYLLQKNIRLLLVLIMNLVKIIIRR